MTVRITIDHENNGQEWWDAASAAPDCPAGMLPLVHGNEDTVTMLTEDAQHCLRWAQSLPGWQSGNQIAPNPLLIDGPA